MENSARDKHLTNRQGHPIVDNQNSRTVGEIGPMLLDNYNFFEKMANFNREKIPERIVHARGAGAHGYFEAYGKIGDRPASELTRAQVLHEKGKQTPVFVRFSTVLHSAHSPETIRDPRGMAIKFYTEQGNWDLVCNNIPVFFIRDPIKFPDLVHALKPDPITDRQHKGRVFDFISKVPETLHFATWLYGPHGIPASYREMEAFGVNAFKLINVAGEAVLCKFNWHPKMGLRTLSYKEACEIQAVNFNHASQDLYEAIERGEFPEWELTIQTMSDTDHPDLDFDPLDPTKLWPEEKFPHMPAGRLVLNRNPADFFAEVEQSAFGPATLVDGIELSNDRLLVGRAFAYADTQRYRIGANYLQLPINRPKSRVLTNQRSGPMDYRADDVDESVSRHTDYEPSNQPSLIEAPRAGHAHEPEVHGKVVQRRSYRVDDYSQPGQHYRAMNQSSKDQTVFNLAMAIGQGTRAVQEAMVVHLYKADEDLGTRLADALKVARPGPMSAAAE